MMGSSVFLIATAFVSFVFVGIKRQLFEKFASKWTSLLTLKLPSDCWEFSEKMNPKTQSTTRFRTSWQENKGGSTKRKKSFQLPKNDWNHCIVSPCDKDEKGKKSTCVGKFCDNGRKIYTEAFRGKDLEHQNLPITSTLRNNVFFQLPPCYLNAKTQWLATVLLLWTK